MGRVPSRRPPCLYRVRVLAASPVGAPARGGPAFRRRPAPAWPTRGGYRTRFDHSVGDDAVPLRGGRYPGRGRRGLPKPAHPARGVGVGAAAPRGGPVLGPGPVVVRPDSDVPSRCEEPGTRSCRPAAGRAAEGCPSRRIPSAVWALVPLRRGEGRFSGRVRLWCVQTAMCRVAVRSPEPARAGRRPRRP